MPQTTSIENFKAKALHWATKQAVCCLLDSNAQLNYTDAYGKYPYLLAVGVEQELLASYGNAFESLKQFRETYPGWSFGFMAYDLKNELENLNSRHADPLAFPDLYFFVPKYVIGISPKGIEVLKGDIKILEEIESCSIPHHIDPHSKINLQAKISKTEYLAQVEKLQKHILAGDIYEINFCQEFFATESPININETYLKLHQLSPTPFAAFFKYGERYILSASPERYLAKRGHKIISQPIKGTAKRGVNTTEDEQLKLKLQQDPKERAENIMIVDLVRNDLSHVAEKGTVKVEELCAIYSFPQVHQMISTISCELRANLNPVDAIKHSFPMGSMTGAPKIKAMELIEQYEHSHRGIYSGALGYMDPQGDFDFNVLIRSIFYHAQKQYLSFQVGGAITAASIAEQEYEECLLKASAMVKALS